MSYLKEYLEEKNRWRAGAGLLNPHDSIDDREAIKQMILFDLSPENLYMDGEASQEEARERYELLIGASRELEALQ